MRLGVFDSGVGGITVLAELRSSFPSAEFVYLGDTAHVPYGPRSAVQIEKLSLDCVRFLKARGVDALIVACNTAASVALDSMVQEMSPIPVFGVVGPGVEASLNALEEVDEGAPVLILATRATVNSHAYSRILKKFSDSREAQGKAPFTIYEQACPLLVPMIEEGWIDHPILHQTLDEYIRPYLQSSKPGVALLGCTHYPWIHRAFENALPGWKVVNSARAVVDSLKKSAAFKVLQKNCETESSQGSYGSGQVDWIFTDPKIVPEFARRYIEQGRPPLHNRE